MPVSDEERRLIDDLFDKLRDTERQAPPRDPEADALIEERMRAQPGAAYLMAQTIVVQERALEQAQARLSQAERGGGAQGGGFLSGLLGGRDGDAQRRARAQPRPGAGRGGPWGGGGMPGRGGGGFLAGAAQTAVGVAGGVVLGSMLMNAFDGDGTETASLADTGGDAGGAEDQGGGDFGGGEDFGGGDFGEF